MLLPSNVPRSSQPSYVAWGQSRAEHMAGSAEFPRNFAEEVRLEDIPPMQITHVVPLPVASPDHVPFVLKEPPILPPPITPQPSHTWPLATVPPFMASPQSFDVPKRKVHHWCSCKRCSAGIKHEDLFGRSAQRGIYTIGGRKFSIDSNTKPALFEMPDDQGSVMHMVNLPHIPLVSHPWFTLIRLIMLT